MEFKHSFYVLCATFMVATCAYAQKKTSIIVHSEHAADKEVKVTVPIDGNYFQNNQISSQISTENTTSIEFDLPKEGIVRVINDFRYVNLMLKPGDHLDVYLKPNQGIQITGDNAAGQELYNELYPDNTRSRYVVLEAYPHAERRVEICDSLKSEDLYKFKILLDQNKIDNAFYNRMQIEAEIYYKLLLSTGIFFKMRNHVFSEQIDRKNPPDQSYLTVWQDIYSDLNTNQNWIKSPLFEQHLGRYHSLLRVMNKPLIKSDLPYQLEMINAFRSILKGETLEYAWATCIAGGLADNENNIEWLANWEDFVKEYPSSRLIKPLTLAIEEVQNYHERLADSTTQIGFLEDFSSINSLVELGQRLKGTVAYVDLWATWCGPCRAELQYSIKLHDAIEALGVKPVYLSIDNDNADAKWREMAQGYPLKGVNLRSNPALRKDINDKVPNFNGIPRYLIFDRTGKVANWNAKRPSDMDELLNQLKTIK